MIKYSLAIIAIVNFGLVGFCQSTQNFEKSKTGGIDTPTQNFEKTKVDGSGQSTQKGQKSVQKRPANYHLSDNIMKVDTSKASIEYWQNWMADLTDMGVEKKEDSFFVKKEVLKLMKDETYRKSVYPKQYSWPAVVSLMNKMELKKAFWHLINLYQTDLEHRNIVLGAVFKYDSIMAMDKILLSTYYTYAFTDPQVYRLTNNKPDIYRPDILEKKLRTTKEIVGYIWENRKKKEMKKPLNAKK